jgi:hypothetical protein
MPDNKRPVTFAGHLGCSRDSFSTIGSRLSTRREYCALPDGFQAWESRPMNTSSHLLKTHPGDQWDAE